MKWIVIDIGCLECEEPTKIIGVYNTEVEAEDAANVITQRNGYGTDHSVEVFELGEDLYK